jgi:hypothetical protein
MHLFFVTPVFSGTMIAPWDWKISSDYGPRDCGSTNCKEWFHQAIDYNGPEGEDIKAVEGGEIDRIEYGAGWFIKAGKWTYLHMFTGTDSTLSTSVSSNNWELANATLTKKETNDIKTGNVIILWSDKTKNEATKVLCKKDFAGSQVSFKRSKTGNTIVVKDADGNDIACQGSVDPHEPVGPVGNSGGYPHAHLDLRVNDYKDSPLFYLAHSPDGLPVATIEKPENHHDFTKEEYTNDYKIKVSVNSTGGPDVNRVSMWINVLKDESNKKILSADANEPTFGYGGRTEAGDKRTSNMVKSTGETTGVQPFTVSGDSLGHDRFIYVQNFKS